MRFAASNDDLTGRGPSPVQLFDESVLARIEMHFRDGGVTPNAHVVDVGTESLRILLSTHHANAENTPASASNTARRTMSSDSWMAGINFAW